jgi:hypothetical protein
MDGTPFALYSDTVNIMGVGPAPDQGRCRTNLLTPIEVIVQGSATWNLAREDETIEKRAILHSILARDNELDAP